MGYDPVSLSLHLLRSCRVRPLHASLTPDQYRELRALRRDPDLRPRARLRVEALLLSAGGMKVPQLAAHLDCCEATVRTLLHRFTEVGMAAVHPQPPGFAPDLEHRRRIEEALDRLLHQPRVWTVTTLAEALAEEDDIHFRPRTVRFYLKRMGAKWRGTRWRDSKKVPGRGAGPLLP